VYYDYLYNFPEHRLFLLEKNGIINWMTKEESGLMKFTAIQSFFYKTCELGYHETIDNFKNYFFQGFEWFNSIKSTHVNQIELVTYPKESIDLGHKQNRKEYKIEEKLYSWISIKKLFKYKLKKLFK
jgi:hypothetical protein